MISMMVKSKRALSKKDRRELAKLVVATGHLAAGALIFKQVYSGQPFNPPLATLGILLLALAYAIALTIMKGGDD